MSHPIRDGVIQSKKCHIQSEMVSQIEKCQIQFETVLQRECGDICNIS